MEVAKSNLEMDIRNKLYPVMDIMELLSGRWRIVIMTTLYIGGRMRFNEIRKHIPKITARSLSIDLKHLEEHGVVSRTIKNTSPITVEYELTAYGLTLDFVFEALAKWGARHRVKIMGSATNSR